MSWYYSLKGKQKGPVVARDLLVLEEAGVVTRKTLVWAEGMPDWSDFPAVKEQIKVEAGAEDLSGFAVCAHSSDVRPKSEMISYGDHMIAPEHKDAFLQSLHEGRIVEEQHEVGQMRFVGFWWRLLAFLIDSVVKGAVMLLLGIPFVIMAIPVFKEIGEGRSPNEAIAATIGVGMVLGGIFVVIVYFGFTVFYYTWMVGKYGGTVGKLALGLRIVNADGSRPSYLKAFGRYWGEVLSQMIASTVGQMLMVLIQIVLFGTAAAFGDQVPQSEFSVGLLVPFLLLGVLAMCISHFPWVMAAFMKEKQALHDIVCSTRVAFKA